LTAGNNVGQLVLKPFQLREECGQHRGAGLGEFQHAGRLFAHRGHVTKMVRREGDQLRQHHSIRGGSGRDEILGQIGG